MAITKFGDLDTHTIGELPAVGSQAPPFTVAAVDLSDLTNESFPGQKLVLNIFPSVGTGVCAASVREFNQRAAGLDGVTVLCVSADLPFALKQFCGAEGIENVVTSSVFRNPEFGIDYGMLLLDGGFRGLLARSVVVLDSDGTVLYSQVVPATGQEPDYDAALAAL